MKFLKALTQKKLAKAIVCGLVLNGGMIVCTEQAFAEEAPEPVGYITGAKIVADGFMLWVPEETGKEIKITAEGPGGEKNYMPYQTFGAYNTSGGKITVEGGTFSSSSNSVCGGNYGGNTVNISGGTFNSPVYGGDLYFDSSEGGNTITISGGTFDSPESFVFGSFSREGNNNTINIIGESGKLEIDNNYVENKNALSIIGSVLGSRGDSTGNTLNIAGKNTKISGIANFQNLNFYINNTVKDGDTLLTIEGKYDYWSMECKALDLSEVNVKAGIEKGSSLTAGNKVTLLESESGIEGFDATKIGKLEANDFQDYDLTYELEDEKKLNAIIPSTPDNNDNSKSPVETQAAGLTMLTTGADMLANQSFDSAASAVANEVSAGGSANAMTPFATFGGNKTKIKSGSHVDLKGWNLNLGLAKEVKNKSGKLLFGPVVEYGKGSYDSYLDNGYHGEGDTDYIGGGVMAKQTNNKGFYYEGSLRLGKVSNDYKANANSYDSDSTYFTAHLGLGKTVKLSEKDSLDYYGKYFYTHQKSDDTFMKGADKCLHLDGVNSNRTRIGGRFTRDVNEKSSIYAGLAWQYEFSGTARATFDGKSTPAPSVKGHTGFMELGWKVNVKKNMDLDLNAIGYTGKQKGAGMNLGLNFKF